MEQFDIEQQKKWLIERGFQLEDVAEDDVRVYMKPLGVITLIAEIKNKSFRYSAHVSWRGDDDNYAMFNYKDFRVFHDCLSKLTFVR